MTQPATGTQPIPNLWQDLGLSHVRQTKERLKEIWIQLQPIWKLIQQEYDSHYDNAYHNASGLHPPAHFTPAKWSNLDLEQRQMIAERLGEQAGKTAVQNWITREEAIPTGPNPGASVLVRYQQFWMEWTYSFAVDRESVYMKEQAMVHHNESDVVRTEAMYLVHPVVAALNTDLNIAGRLVLNSEDVLSHVRSGITFFRNDSGPDPRPVAVLEFKRRGIVRPNQLDNAMPRNLPGPQVRTVFEHEAEKLIKQAAAYAVIFRTQHVAVCDWNYLVLFRFHNMPYTAPTSVGPTVEIQYIPIGTSNTRLRLGFHNSDHSHHFRPALLGFLKDAFTMTPP